MKSIYELDRNMALSTHLSDSDLVWHSALDAPFSLHGLFPAEPYRRLPAETAASVSPGVAQLSFNTAGGRIRFRTDSPYVAIHAEMAQVCRMDHMAFTGIFGFDLYQREGEQEVYVGTFRPPEDLRHGYESKLSLPGSGLHELTINFPLYNSVDKLLIGLQDGCEIAAPRHYTTAKPVVFYGSSITQGGCASRPGNSYPAMISRLLDCDYINLGFSGNAKGEAAMAAYIASLEMSLFVCDYDYNAPSIAHLQETHAPLYHAVRARHPDLPILFVSRPDARRQPETEARKRVILQTLERAQHEGDHRVAFVDGTELFCGMMAGDCTVDGCHPNDLGFYRMAKCIGAEVARWLKR